MPHADFKCNVKHAPTSLHHFWEHTVGNSHATMALRVDWQKRLTPCNRELGFANARKTWTDMGSLTANEVSALELAFALIMKPFATSQEKGSVFVEITVPPQGVVYITVETE